MDDEVICPRSPGSLKILTKEILEGNIAGYSERTPFVELVVEEFNETTANDLEDKVAQAYKNDQKFIIIRVHSPGGSVYALSRMLNTIQSAKDSGITVVTMCPGIAMSCGSILLAMGTKGYRFCGPHSAILLHEISGGVKGTMTGMDNELAEYEFDNKNLFRKIAKNAGLEEEDYYYNIVHGLHKDLFIHPTRAMEIGLVDHLFLPRLTKKVTICYELDYGGCKDPSPEELKKMIDAAEKDNVVLKMDVLANIPKPTYRPSGPAETVCSNPPSTPTTTTTTKGRESQGSGGPNYYTQRQETRSNVRLDPTSFY